MKPISKEKLIDYIFTEIEGYIRDYKDTKEEYYRYYARPLIRLCNTIMYGELDKEE